MPSGKGRKKSYAENIYLKYKRAGLAPKYEHAGIYCISIEGQIVYIGKSKNMLMRMAEHKVGTNLKKEHKYEIINEAKCRGLDVKFDVLYYAQAKQPADLIDELGRKEGEYIRLYRPVLNTQIPKADNWRKYSINKNAASVSLADILLGQDD